MNDKCVLRAPLGTLPTIAAALILSAAPSPAQDCDGNGIPDAQEIRTPGVDINGNGVPDVCDVQRPVFAPPRRWHDVLSAFVRAADMDADGDLDLVVRESTTTEDSLLVLLNDGAAHFDRRWRRTISMGPVALRVGRLNADNYPDVAMVINSTRLLHVFLSSGDGNFEERTFEIGGYPSALALVDLDGDGDLDAIVATTETNPAIGALSWLANDGAGTFGASLQLAARGGITDIAAGDLDRDGDADLVAVGRSGSPVVRNDGAAGFSVSWLAGLTTGNFCESVGPRTLALADMDSDGVLDLVVETFVYSTLSCGTTPASVFVFRGRGDATFESTASTLNDSARIRARWFLVTCRNSRVAAPGRSRRCSRSSRNPPPG
ncbi:MAG: VCBS repeat-containing protein [Phycisphaerae bacterium]